MIAAGAIVARIVPTHSFERARIAPLFVHRCRRVRLLLRIFEPEMGTLASADGASPDVRVVGAGIEGEVRQTAEVCSYEQREGRERKQRERG